MLTTPEEPVHCVGQLKNRNVKGTNILTGHYRLKDDRVTIILQRQEKKNIGPVYKRGRWIEIKHEHTEQTFHVVSRIPHIKKNWLNLF